MFDPEKLLTVIRTAASEVFDAKRPCNFLVGRVGSVSPLSVKCGGLDIPSDMLSVCAAASERLRVGAIVAVLRAEGGQRYLLLDTLSDGRGGGAA